MNSHQIREAFLEFFRARDHEIVASSALIPQDDPTLLFTNAGMNQFKDLLLGQERRAYTRAADAQKCMRVSGKHNDLEAVGRDGRHHTFFEMLGNWSFGDYGKEEAIRWAWTFLTEVMELDQEKLLVSVYRDDDESYRIWNETIGLAESRIYRLGNLEEGDEENFWSMGDTGPCGPCTEIHYDQGPEVAGGDERPLGENESDRFLEIWNLVFIHYDRDEDGKLSPLPLQSVDTGMGLERLVALKAGVTSNYDTDLFAPLLEWVRRESGADAEDPEQRVSMQVIADHVRALAFAVADGGRPGNDGRGYVLRRILRRAARHGRNLGFREAFLYRAADVVIEQMGEHYSELRDARDHIQRVLRTEEERFNETLDRGLHRFSEFAEQARARSDRRITGEQAFQLHDTFGFPLDLTCVMAEEGGLAVDQEGFDRCMEEQRSRARAAGSFATADRGGEWIWADGEEPGADRAPVDFVGYDQLEASAQLIGVRPVDSDEFEVVLDPSPFYAESGGQVGDRGWIASDDFRLEVLDTQKGHGGPVCRVRVADGSFGGESSVGTRVEARVDAEIRNAILRNHTATHLLHSALRHQLGDHAQQAGSLVGPDKLRFDFHHDGALGREGLAALEAEVNAHVLANHPVTKHVDLPLDRAREMGAIAMFGEKYGDRVRVIEVAGVSTEFCGGTHCDFTGQIGMLRITGEAAVGAGIRRVEAVTGEAAVALAQAEHALLRDLSEKLSTRPEELPSRIDQLQTEVKELRAEVLELHRSQAGDLVTQLLDQATDLGGLRLVAARIEVADRQSMMDMGDQLRAQLGSGAAVLGTEVDGKVAFLAVVTDDLIERGLRAGDLVKAVAKVAGGSGGGRPHLAQAGAKDPSKIDEAVAVAESFVRDRLKGQV